MITEYVCHGRLPVSPCYARPWAGHHVFSSRMEDLDRRAKPATTAYCFPSARPRESGDPAPFYTGSLSSQTKCNTFLERCCDGTQVRAAVIGGPIGDCQTSRRWLFGPANRGSSGSLAIVDLSGAESATAAATSATNQVTLEEQTRARRWAGSRLERDGALRGAVLERLARGWSPEQIAGRLAREAGAQSDQLREHLPLRLRPDRPPQGLQLASLPAARQEQEGVPRAGEAEARKLHQRPYFADLTPSRRRHRKTGEGARAAQYGKTVLIS